MITAVLSGISIASIIIVTTVLMLKQNELSNDYNQKIKRVVSQVNEVNATGYNVLQNQESELGTTNKNLENIRATYVTSEGLSNRVATTSTNIGKDYEINKDPKNNNLNINLPQGKQSGFSLVSGEQTKFAVDGETGKVSVKNDVNVTGNLKGDKLQLGDKFLLSGVGDAHGNDSWLRFFDKDGKDYYGGVATANLWSRDNSYLNGNTYINGTLRANGTISTPNGNTMHSDGRQHISAGEQLYLLPKDGVSIGKEWGGTGDLRVQGNTDIGGSTQLHGALNVNDGNNDGSQRGINLWHPNDKRFGMWMGETSENGGKSLTGGPVANGDISNHSVRFSTGNWGGHGFVFQNSDGRPLMSIKGDDARTNVYGPLNINDGNNDGSQRGLNLWHQNDRRFGMWMSDTAPNGGKSLTGGPVADGGIGRHSVRFSTGNWDGHGFVFQNSDGGNLMSIKGDDARTNVYGQLSVNPLAADSGVNHGLNLWHPGDRRFGMFMSTPGKGKGLGGGDVPDGGIAAHSVRFTTGNNPAHGFVFQNSDGKALMSIKGDDGRLNTYGDLNANGNVRLNGTVTAPNGHTIHNDGRQHISAGEQLYLLPKDGVSIGKEWGGTGDLRVQGNLSTGGDTNINGKLTVSRGDGNWNWARIVGNHADNIYVGSDGGNRGIWADGNRNFSVYNQGNPGMTVDTAGNAYAAGNQIKLSTNWTGYPDNSHNSEIANDTNGYKGLMIVGNKSGGGERRVGIWDTLNVNGTTNANGTLNANGNVRLNGTVTAPNGHTIHNDGRQHISAGEILYLLPKSGVQIGREWGGTGSLNVQGDLSSGGKNNLTSGGWAVGNGFMAPGSLTIGDINQNYGNGNNWNKSTSGLLMECADKTEIAVHDAGTRVASLMKYDGPTNQITLGRDMAWGPTGGINMAGPVNIQGKWRLGDTGDDWLRINAPGRSDGNGYYGGVAAGRLWTAQGGLAGSDSRMKDNVIDISKTNSDNLLKLNPKAYTYKDDKDKRQRFGFIAQEVEKVYPNMVSEGANGMKSLNYDDIIPLTVANIKDIRKSIPDNKSLCIDGVCLNKNDLINLKKLSSL
jgi:hypothetical protein